MSRRDTARRAEIVSGVAQALPLLLAVCAYGLIFGAQATQKGLRLAEVPLMTGTNYAGGSEFAAINLWAKPPPVLLIALVTLLINSRHVIMGAALTPFIRRFPRAQAFAILFFMSDECWAVSLDHTRRRAEAGSVTPFSLPFYVGCAGAIYLGWLVSTTAGALLGPALGDLDRYGFDMAFPAVFLSIVAGMWRGWGAARPWLVSLTAAALASLLLPGAWYVVIGTGAGLAAAALRTAPA